MKKALLISALILFCGSVFSLDIPDSLLGIWEGKDRYVFFENQGDKESPEIVVVLKTYYGWYLDRASEPSSYSETEARTRNNATHKEAEHITFELNPVSRCTLTDNVWELTFRYSKRDINYVPVAIIDNKMYLDFFIKDKIPVYDENGNPVVNENPYNGLWRGNAVSEGIKICTQKEAENIGAFYIWDDKIYNIRYWKSDMDFSSDAALYSKNDTEFNVDSHLFSAGNVYSCVSGRSHKIRNPQDPVTFNPEDYIFDEDKNILVCDKEPYLVKLLDKNTMEQLMEIVKQANSRHAPKEKPLFEDSQLDWHWDVIDELEKNSELVQQVRRRQEEFGPRGKDSGK